MAAKGLTRVSPGVYRDARGNLTDSNGKITKPASKPSSKPSSKPTSKPKPSQPRTYDEVYQEYRNEKDPTKRRELMGELQDVKKAPPAPSNNQPPPPPPTPEQVQAGEDRKDARAINDLIPGANAAAALADRFVNADSYRNVSTGIDAQGNRLPERQEILDRYKAIANVNADGGRSAEMQGNLARMKSLQQGYSAPEMQGMRENAMRGLNDQYQTQLAQMNRAQARGNVRGAAAQAGMRGLNRDRLRSQQEMEQGLFVKGADEIRNATASYNAALKGSEADEYARQTGSLKNYNESLASMRNEEFDRQKYNNEQNQSFEGAKAGTFFGGAELGLANRTADDNRKLNNQMLQIMKKRTR